MEQENQSPPDEIEITEEMIEAGKDAFYNYDWDDSAGQIVWSVFKAMYAKSKQSAAGSR